MGETTPHSKKFSGAGIRRTTSFRSNQSKKSQATVSRRRGASLESSSNVGSPLRRNTMQPSKDKDHIMRLTSRESTHIMGNPLTEEETQAQLEDMAVLEQIKNEN
jgi:hypothetical protein